MREPLDYDTLASELADIQKRYRMQEGLEFGFRETRGGAVVYVARSPNGYHESTESHAHALWLLVDSFRTRIEDTPEVHARLQALSGDIQAARIEAMRIAAAVRKENPDATGPERDTLVLVALDRREQGAAAAQAEADAASAKGPVSKP